MESGPELLRNPIFCDFSGRFRGSGPPVIPSGSAHAMHTILYIDADQTMPVCMLIVTFVVSQIHAVVLISNE